MENITKKEIKQLILERKLELTDVIDVVVEINGIIGVGLISLADGITNYIHDCKAGYSVPEITKENQEKQMSELLKEYNEKCVQGYYDIIIESFTNGQKKQAKNQFNAMPENERKDFLYHISDEESLKDMMHYFIQNL